MSVFLLILGLIILVSISTDVLVTTVTLRGGGFLTNRLSSWLWHSVTRMHRRHSSHRLLAAAGLFIVLGMAILWYLMTWVGWSLIFNSFENAIINSADKEPTSTLGRIYFSAYTLTTLGRGDYLPTNIIWHLFTALAAANGFFLVTLSITYLFSLISAVIQKRSLAVYISSLGGTPDEIVINAWTGKDFGNLDQHLISLTPAIVELSEQYLAYPVLHYFHTSERSRSLALSMAALDEAMSLLQYAVLPEHRPDAASLNTVRRASSAFLRTLRSDYIEPDKCEPKLMTLGLLRTEFIPVVSDREFQRATKHINRRRRLLLALVKNDGWNWDAISSSLTTSRAKHLDDFSIIDDLIAH